MSQRGPNQPWEHGELGPGVLVTPTIRLERQLGSGGMGSVWLAEHLTLRAQVVVKFMAREFASNPEARLRFEREASLAAQAKSPHVVQIFDHGTALFGLPYIAMELLEGEDLAKRIEREGRIEPHLFSDLLSQACRGLARAHAKGITHRDIKPENIFLCEDDGRLLVKLLDFGIAKVEAGGANFSATQTGMLLGTAYYMSPEQTLGQRDVDQRADLWALGVVSYFALTGRRPFGGNTLGALAIEVTSAAIVPPSAHDPRLGPGVDGWMAKALARPREQRFQSAKAMAEAFEQALAQLSLHATVYDRASSGPLASPTLASNAPPPLRVASTMSPSIRNASDSARAATSPSQKRR
ncbi:MAG TPA: serine/threonine-protein kinase, partial [Polyangiaceae bacterium]|nr:serine/threonine-protein kinase [Polyangiaceae bacterium]